MITQQQARTIMKQYGSAWIQQDTSALISLFSENAVYAERGFESPYKGQAQIAQYWNQKVVEEQRDISFELHHVFVDNNTVIAEFSASAFSTVKNKRVQLQSVCVFEVNTDGLITNWREYWHSKWVAK